MGHDAVKLELIEWLKKLEDKETIEYLKIVKDAKLNNQDWWNELTKEQKAGIQRGLKNIDDGHVVPHEVVKSKYGL